MSWLTQFTEQITADAQAMKGNSINIITAQPPPPPPISNHYAHIRLINVYVGLLFELLSHVKKSVLFQHNGQKFEDKELWEGQQFFVINGFLSCEESEDSGLFCQSWTVREGYQRSNDALGLWLTHLLIGEGYFLNHMWNFIFKGR